MSGWFIVYRCGCTDAQPTPEALKKECPVHGQGSNHGPSLVASVEIEPGFQEAS